MKKLFTLFSCMAICVTTAFAVNSHSKVLSFTASDVATISSTTTKTTNYLGNSCTWTLTATSTYSDAIAASSRVCDSITFADRFNPNGAGVYGSYRTIEFTANPGDTLVVYAVAGTTSTNRWLRLQRSSDKSDTTGVQLPNSNYSVASTVVNSVTNTVPKIQVYVFPSTFTAGNVALFSVSSGIYVYRVEINPASTTTGINNPTIDHGTAVKTEYLTITGASAGIDPTALPNGIYIKKITYSDGAVVSQKTLLKK